MNQFLIFHILLEYIYIILTSYGPLVYWKWRGREREGKGREERG